MRLSWRTMAISVVGCILLLDAPLFAESGLALRFSDSSTIALGVPIFLTPVVRLEPEVSGTYYKNSSEEANIYEYKRRALSFGLALFLVPSPDASVRAYFGPRGGYSVTKDTSSRGTPGFSAYESERPLNGWFGSFVLGGECRIWSSWSLGAEGELVHDHLSGTSETLEFGFGRTETEVDSSSTFTRFSFVLRWFFWGIESE